jgi:hypothetical protein
VKSMPNPWQITVIPVQSFPATSPERVRQQIYFRAFGEAVLNAGLEHHQVLLQSWKLDAPTSGRTLNDHMQQWIPKLGLGLWPDREPPQSWTETSFVNAAAAVFRGDEPTLNAYPLYRLTASAVQLQAAQELRASGTLIETFSRRPASSVLETARQQALDTIIADRYRSENFYFPLLDRRSIAASRTPEQLDRWLCGIDLYLRESPEDKGILIVSRIPLNPLFAATDAYVRTSLTSTEPR